MNRKLNAEEVEAQLSQFFGAAFTKTPRKIMGVDGTSFMLEISHEKETDIYEWWSWLPKEWLPIKILVEKLYEWIGYSYELEVFEEDI